MMKHRLILRVILLAFVVAAIGYMFLRDRTSSSSSSGQAASTTAAATAPGRSGFVAYYFHNTRRCPTCRAIESQANDVVQVDFASELKSGAVAWKVLNYEEPSGAGLAKKFDIQMPVVVLASMKGGEIAQWKRLDRVWALVGDKPGYASYLRDEIRQMVRAAEPQPTLAPAEDESKAKESVGSPESKPESLPVDLPIPQ